MRISDWSSDVCSSDLFALGFLGLPLGVVDEYDDSLPFHVEPGIVVPALFGGVDAVTDEDDVAVLDRGLRLDAIAECDIVLRILRGDRRLAAGEADRKSTRLNSSH